MVIIQVEDTRNVEVRKGDEVTLEVPGGTTPGLWELEASPDAVEVIGHEVVADEERVGGRGVERFIVRSVRAGNATLRLQFKAPWEAEPMETFDVCLRTAQP